MQQPHGVHALGPGRRVKVATLSAREIIYKDRDTGRIEALAGTLEATLAKAILEAFQAQKDSLSISALIAALESGDVGKVLRLLDLPAALAGFDKVPPVVQGGVYAAGTATAATILPRITSTTFVFNQLNPRLLTWLQTYNLGLIKQINDTTKEGVRQYLLAGMAEGRNPKDVARQVKGIVGLTERQAQAVKNYRKQLETFHLRRSADTWGLGRQIDRVNGTQVLRPDADGTPLDGIDQRRLRDFRYDGQLKRAMSTGKPLTAAQIDKMVGAYERKYLAYRARTIARTETIRTLNVGVQDAWQQAIDKGTVSEDLVRKRWLVARDERLCAVCGPIPKMNPPRGVKHAEAFKTPNGPTMLPPIHPNCRCSVNYRVYEPSQLQEP